MLVDWAGKSYEYDMAMGITVKEAMPIKMHTGYGVKSWWRGVSELEPESVQALLWLLKRRNGEQCDMASLDFDIPAFVNAFNQGAEHEVAKMDAAPKAEAGSAGESTG